MAILAPPQTLSVGSMQITYLPDGEFAVYPSVLYPHVASSQWEKYARLRRSDGHLLSNVGAHLIQTATETILVDTGMGPSTVTEDDHPYLLSGGELLESLKRRGLSPHDIDMVFYTHLHRDHVGWTGQNKNGKKWLTFPHARYFIRREEWLKWEQSPMKPAWLQEAGEMVAPRLELLEDGQALADGVLVRAAPGHTCGHSVLVVTSLGKRVLLLGDSFHSVISIEHPEWIDAFDENPILACQTRLSLLQELRQPATIAAAIHLWPSTFGYLALGTDPESSWSTISSLTGSTVLPFDTPI